MKKLLFTRNQILRAIHAAAVCLLFALTATHTHAQTYTAPFTISGTTVSATSPGNYTSPVGFYDDTHTYSSISVGPGVTIDSTAGYTGTIGGSYADINTASAFFTNRGSLSLSTTNVVNQAAVNLTQDATSLTVNNSGTLSSVGSGGTLTFGAGLETTSNSGNITVTNSGTMSATGGTNSSNYGAYLHSNSGNLAFTNSGTGTLTTTGSAGYDLRLLTGGNGSVTISNAGTMSGGHSGIAAQTNTGATHVVNTGTISIAGAGIANVIFVGASGPVTVTNDGVLMGANSDFGINVQGADSIKITNNKSISGGVNGIFTFGNDALSVTNTGDITSSGEGIEAGTGGSASVFNIRNTGVINSGTYGIQATGAATVYDSGDINAITAIGVLSGSSVTLAGQPVISGTISGGSSNTSTSKLTFALVVPVGQLAADKAELNADIATYKQNNGGNLTFNIGTLSFDISDFDYGTGGIIDALVASRLYANVAGFRSIGTVLDNLNSNNPQAGRILGALGNVSNAGLQGALSELTPKSLEIFRNVAFDNNTFNSTEINNHLANLRDGLTGFDSSALSISEPNMDPTLSQVKDHLLAYTPMSHPDLVSDAVDPVLAGVDAKDMKFAQVNTMPTDRWSTFIAGKVILANLSSNFPFQNSNYTTGAVTAGADYRLDQHFTVGALVSYAHTGIDLDDRGSKATVDSYTPGIYASYVDGGWYANGLGTYVRNAYTEDRRIDIPGLAGDNHGGTSGNQGTANLTGGYEFQSGAFKFGPVASIEYVHLAIESMQEQGTAALDINEQNQDSLRTLFGFEGRYAAKIGSLLLVPHASVSWQHEYLDNSDGITSQFDGAGGGSFSTETDAPDRNSAFIDAGLDATVNSNVTIFIDYSTQAGQENFYAQSAQSGVRIGF